MRFGESFFPVGAFGIAHDYVIVADHFGHAFGRQAMQMPSDFILVSDQDGDAPTCLQTRRRNPSWAGDLGMYQEILRDHRVENHNVRVLF